MNIVNYKAMFAIINIQNLCVEDNVHDYECVHTVNNIFGYHNIMCNKLAS